jgi:hypothetical protein
MIPEKIENLSDGAERLKKEIVSTQRIDITL